MKSPAFICSSLKGLINQMLWAPKDWAVKPIFLVQQWNGRHSLNPKWWKLVSGSYRAILGKRTRKFYNTSLFYKVPLDHENFLAPKNKPSEKNLNYLQMHMSNSLVPISTKPVHVLFGIYEHTTRLRWWKIYMLDAVLLFGRRWGWAPPILETAAIPWAQEQLFSRCILANRRKPQICNTPSFL